MTKFSKFLIAIFLLSGLLQLTPANANAQVSSDGKDFWIGFMYPSYNKVAAPATLGFYGAYLLISSYEDNSVSVEFYDRNTGVEAIGSTYVVSARTAVQVPMPLSFVMMGDTGDIPEYAACHVKAKRPIKVEFFSTGASAGGSFLALQTAMLGKKYVIASYGDNDGNGGLAGKGPYGPKALEDSHGFFEIIAPFDGTTVKITPNSTTMGGHIGYHSGVGHSFPTKIPYTVSLSRGQCYVVKSAGSQSSDDISGSIVESNLPVAVIAGHENAFIGGLTNHGMEGRNFMVQQMVPTQFWDSTGYIMIPLKDSQPEDVGIEDGEDYRTYSDSGAKINLTLGSVSGPVDMSTDELKQPATEDFRIAEPVDFESTNGKKFSVIMYDRRNFANAVPFPAPSMMTVVPMKNWKTSYLWYVPANKFETMQAYYCDIIAATVDLNATKNGLVASFNGGQITQLKGLLSQEQQWKGQIPNHPDLTGVRFKLSAGCYYAHGPHPFIVYNFGFRGIDPDFNIGDFDYDDFFFSYGSPAGMSVSGDSHIRITVDTFCSYWNVCVHDSSSGFSEAGIRSITLMDDPDGNEYELHPNRPIVFNNARLDDSLDPGHNGIIMHNGTESDICFKVLINKPLDTAYAPLFITDNNGGAKMVELHYTPPQVKITLDTARFNNIMLQKSTCSTFVFKNTAKIIPGVPKSYPFVMRSVALALNNPTFQITSIEPQLPTTLYAGDSVVITACFTPTDTTTQIDTILLSAGCFTEPIDLKGNGAIPQIWASNHDFGSVIVDSTKCDTVGVYNIGKLPFTLTKDWVLENMGVNFTFENVGSTSPKSYGSNDLPIVLQPAQKILFRICYTPHDESMDTTIMHWATTLQDPYKSSIKDSSILYGSGVKTGFVWDRTVQPMQIDTSKKIDSEIVRVYLLNNAPKGVGSPPTHVSKVYFSGTDTSDFHIFNNQRGFFPPDNFNLNAGDSMWFDILFHPDLSKPYSVRQADLVASDPSEKDKFIHFTGTILAKSSVKALQQLPSFSIRPNPASGNSVIISLPEQMMDGSITIFDVLGREVYRQDIFESPKEINLPIGNIPNGLYYLRLETPKTIITLKLEVLK